MVEFYTRKLFNFSGSKKRVNGSSNVESIFLIAASEMQFWLRKIITGNQNFKVYWLFSPQICTQVPAYSTTIN